MTGIGPDKPSLEVIAIVADVPAGALDQSRPMMAYEPYALIGPAGMSFAVRTAVDPASLMRAVRTVFSSIDPENGASAGAHNG